MGTHAFCRCGAENFAQIMHLKILHREHTYKNPLVLGNTMRRTRAGIKEQCVRMEFMEILIKTGIFSILFSVRRLQRRPKAEFLLEERVFF
jgi:hypothetical protein